MKEPGGPLPGLSAVSRENLHLFFSNPSVLTSGSMECLAIKHFDRNFPFKAKLQRCTLVGKEEGFEREAGENIISFSALSPPPRIP